MSEVKVRKVEPTPLFDYYYAFSLDDETVYLHKLKSGKYPRITIGSDTGNMGFVKSGTIIQLIKEAIEYNHERYTNPSAILGGPE